MTEVRQGVLFGDCASDCVCDQPALLCIQDCLTPGDAIQEELPGISALLNGRPREQTRKPPPRFRSAQRISLPPPNFIELDTGACCDRDNCPACEYGWHQNCKFGCTLKN